LALMEVGTARKGPALAAIVRDLRLGVGIETVQSVHQVPPQIVAERVELVAPV